jgi:tRNA pseudouridine38-40 synthase
MRYFLEIAFDGKPFVGWQIQPNGPSVQQKVNDILSTIQNEKIYVIGCGRTDAGVHAKSFYLHFDTNNIIHDTRLFLQQFNGIAPDSIAAYHIFPVDDSMHARFSAVKRTYQYLITTVKSPFYQGWAYHHRYPLNISLINDACNYLLGEKDFKAFSKTNDLHHHLCTIFQAQFMENDTLITFEITANRFLRNMVRAIVGTLLDIGKGKKQVSQLHDILLSKERKMAGQSVPAHGLYLTHIEYPPFLHHGSD